MIPTPIDPRAYKPGWTTTEFWLTLITQMACFGLLAGIWMGYLSPDFEYAQETLLAAAIGKSIAYESGRYRLKRRLADVQNGSAGTAEAARPNSDAP